MLRRVIVPLALPGIAAASIFGFVNAWGSFVVPLILISPANQQPAPIAIYTFLTLPKPEFGNIAAYSLIFCVPVFILYADLLAAVPRGLRPGRGREGLMTRDDRGEFGDATPARRGDRHGRHRPGHAPALPARAGGPLRDRGALRPLAPERRSGCADEYGVPSVFTDWREMLASQLDAVLILTSGSHAPIAIEAARAGRHVFVEKPMCFSTAEATEMVDEAASRPGST